MSIIKKAKTETKDVKATSETKGKTLACWLGLHAWYNGVCVRCGAVKK